MRRTQWVMGGLALVAACGLVLAYADGQQSKSHYEPGVARLDGYRLGESPTQLIVFFATGSGDIVVGPSVTEDADKVFVTVRTSVLVPGRGLFKNASATLGRVTITLHDSVGGRSVVDANTGSFLQRQLAQ